MQNGDLEEAVGVREGEVLEGKYHIEKVLGAGGMGIVVAARHQHLDTRIAIKFLHPAMAQNEEAVSRFTREARAAVKITGEHVARVLDVGTLANGAPFMVMEFLDGIDLSAWLRHRGPLPVELAVDFVLQVCVAVAEAHSLGIVHRDLKPSNLFCVRRADGQLSIKVLDFGISKVTSVASLATNRAVTQTSAIMGSPLYMSPEQMTSARGVDSRADIWALGIILHELLAGRAPFQGETLPEICINVATSPPASLRQTRPDVPPGLEAVVLRCLEKDRDARYRNVGEFAVALSRFGPATCRALVDAILGILQSARQSVDSSGPAPLSNAMPRGDTRTFAAGSIPSFGWTDAGTKSRKAWGPLAVGIAAVLLGAAAGYALLRPGARAPEPRPPASAAAAPPSAAPEEPRTPQPSDWLLAPAPAPAASDDFFPHAGPIDDDTPASNPKLTATGAVKPLPRPIRRHGASPATPAASDGTSTPSPRAHPAAGGNCDPPFFFDDQGNRVFKTECVN